jgi:mannosyltransferase OCH1-like enzyme
MAMDVPKIIWQTHEYKFDNLPEHLKKISKTWTNINPGWEYIYHDRYQREAVVERYPDLFKLYKKFSRVYQSEIWRFIVTYEHGGVYADMDSICIQPLDYMLKNINDCEIIVVKKSRAFSGTKTNYFYTNTANYAVKKESKVIKDVLNRIVLDDQNIESPWLCFVDTVDKSENVLYDFSAACHSYKFKVGFDSNFLVDDYGSSIKYLDFLEKYNLSII